MPQYCICGSLTTVLQCMINRPKAPADIVLLRGTRCINTTNRSASQQSCTFIVCLAAPKDSEASSAEQQPSLMPTYPNTRCGHGMLTMPQTQADLCSCLTAVHSTILHAAYLLEPRGQRFCRSHHDPSIRQYKYTELSHCHPVTRRPP